MDTDNKRVKFTYTQGVLSLLIHLLILIIIWISCILFLRYTQVAELFLIEFSFWDEFVLGMVIIICFLCIRVLYCFPKYRSASSKQTAYSVEELSKLTGINKKRVVFDLRMLFLFNLFNPTNRRTLYDFMFQPDNET